MSDRTPRLSERVRPNSEVAPWVVTAIKTLENELDAAKEKLADYEMAAKYPGDDQRHRGASVASQLVHAQHMREKAEAERDAAVQNLADADLAYDSASQEVQRQDAEIEILTARVQRLTDALKGTYAELLSVLTAINEDRIPHDGDEFHERLKAARAAIAAGED